MTILTRNKNQEVDYLLGSNYEGIHARLVEVLGERRAALFAQPQNRRAKGEHWWYAVDGPQLQPFSSAPDSLKDEIGDQLRELTDDVRDDILRDSELGRFGEKIFIFPDENKLFYREVTGEVPQLVIAQWGCQRAGGNNDGGPLHHLVNRPKKDHSPLTLAATYSNGDLYAEKTLLYTYKGRPKQIRTDENGQAAIGQVQNGDQVVVAAEEDEEFARPHTVINTEEQEFFPVVLPYFRNLNVEVVNQKDVRLPDYPVELEANGKRVAYRTDETGSFTALDLILDGSPIRAFDVANPSISQELIVDKNTAFVTFVVKERFFAPVKLELLTDADKAVAAFDLTVEFDGQERKVTSDDAGLINLAEVPEDSLLIVKQQGEIVARQEFSVVEKDNNFVVRVNPPIPNVITVTLIDKNDKPIPDTAIDFQSKTSLEQKVTDENGKLTIVDPPYSAEEKVKATVYLKREGKKPKGKKTKIRYREDQKDYVIKVKQRNWWWLLLLLLPLLLLLLLLEFDKDINVHTFESGTNTDIAGAAVEASYVRHALWKSGSGLFVADTITRADTSDAAGITRFSALNYTLYSVIFKRSTEFTVRSKTNCHDAGNASTLFHEISDGGTMEVEMDAVVVPLDFQVVDAEDGQPLPGADFIFESEYNGQIRREALKSDANGKVVVNSLPKCGKLQRAHASLYGFYPDSIAPISIEELANADPEKRKLKLKPKKENITFFVVNCNNGEPIPNALVTIFVGQDKQGKKFYTNVDGKGKGGYDNLRILDSVRIEGKKPPYFKPGVWKGKATVEEFVKLPDSMRVLCLEPEEQLIKFTDVDSLTQRPLAGVKNLVKITSGDSTREMTLTSNRNGVIEIPIKLGDKFSIEATHPPGYQPQRRKFKQAKADDYVTGKNKDTKIPLSPVMVTHEFRTVSPALNKLVDNASLIVTVDGKRVAPNNSGNGVFKVTGTYSSRISITASKTGYKTNNYTVKNVAFSLLKTKVPAHTDIPMEFPECGIKTEGDVSGKTYYRDIYQMGQLSGTFRFKYYTDSQFDEINVYCGDSVDPSNLIWNNLPPNQPGTKDEVVLLKFNCNVPVITVEVKGESNWDYTVSCPN